MSEQLLLYERAALAVLCASFSIGFKSKDNLAVTHDTGERRKKNQYIVESRKMRRSFIV